MHKPHIDHVRAGEVQKEETIVELVDEEDGWCWSSLCDSSFPHLNQCLIQIPIQKGIYMLHPSFIQKNGWELIKQGMNLEKLCESHRGESTILGVCVGGWRAQERQLEASSIPYWFNNILFFTPAPFLWWISWNSIINESSFDQIIKASRSHPLINLIYNRRERKWDGLIEQA